MKFASKLAALLLATGLTAAAAADKVVGYVAPKATTNPPPAVTLNTFQRFELRPFAMDAPYSEQQVNVAALERLQANLDKNAGPIIAEWNAKGGPEGRTLRIEPQVRHIRFVSGKTRFWAGGFAGASAVLVTVKLTDAETGELIAEPEFYQHAKGMAGAWTFGAADGAMLIRITTMISYYLSDNYAAQASTPTSVSPEPRP